MIKKLVKSLSEELKRKTREEVAYKIYSPFCRLLSLFIGENMTLTKK